MHTKPLLTTLAAMALLVTTGGTAAASVSSGPRPCAQPDGRVNSIAVSGGTAYLGGSFKAVRNRAGALVARSGLAAVDTASCDLLPWTANTDGEVIAVKVSGGRVYAGGEFSKVAGASRSRLAAVSTASGALLPFAPSANRTVRALAVSGTTLYAGGDFTKVDASTRNKLAAFSLSTGALSASWTPRASGMVSTLALSATDDAVYVGGAFAALGGDKRAAYLGAVGALDGDLDKTFLPKPGWPILNVVADSRGVYAGGGGSGGHLGIWDLDGSLQRPIYQIDGGVQSVAVDGDSLYAGGHFGNVCAGNTGSGSPFLCDTNIPRRKVFELSLTSGGLTGWAPSLNSPRGVFATEVDPTNHSLWLGGDFTQVGSKPVGHLASFLP